LELDQKTATAIDHVRATLGGSGLGERLAVPDTDVDLAEIVDVLVSAVDCLRVALRTAIENGDECSLIALELLTMQELLDETRVTARDRMLSAFRGVRDALERLRGMRTIEMMLDHGPAELSACVGFDRVVLFRVIDGAMVITRVHDSTDQARGRHLLETSQSNPSLLSHRLLETEMVRRRAPIIVADPENDPRSDKLLIKASQTRCYVAAPIMPSNRVIGFLHADFEHRRVDEVDRDILWSFAEGFGFAIERADLGARLDTQRQNISDLVHNLEATMEGIHNTTTDLVGAPQQTVDAVHRATTLASPQSRVDRLLTRRELEVLEILATGASNSRIAQELVVSEATIKSHVKHILRKLRAANRAEAVYRYRQLTSAEHSG
jgi:LuxR family transcriptional regulator, regulator of acetate metabolism